MRYLQAVSRALLVHPHWLAEVSWPLIAGTLAIALAMNLQNFPLILFVDGGWRQVMVWFLIRCVEGLTLLFAGAFLLQLHDAAWWRPVGLGIAVIVACLAGAALAVAIVDPYAAGDPDMPARTAWLSPLTISLNRWPLVAAAWYLVDRARHRAAMLREEEAMRQRLDTAMAEARLQILEAQVEPHFIFNTLANIRRLCRTDPARARKTVDRFAAYLRTSLPQMHDSGATVGRELDLAAAYLEVQKVRMGRRLTYTVDVDPALRSQAFPRMMLISLVENAIKHGLNPSIEGGTIDISAAAHEGVLRVRVADTGRGFAKMMGSGIGLANIRARLTAMYGARSRLTLAANKPRGIVATIELPLASGEAAAAVEAHAA